MRIAEYKQIDTEYIEKVIHHEATEENEAYDETVTIPKAIMGMVYRDATEEEIAEMQANAPAEIEEDTTIDDLVEAIDILTNIVLGGAE